MNSSRAPRSPSSHLQLPDAQAIAQWRVQRHRLARDGQRVALLARCQPAQRLQARRQAQQHDPQVVCHRQQHPAQRFRLFCLVLILAVARPARALGYPGQFPQIGNKARHRLAATRRQPGVGVADHVVRCKQISGRREIGIVAQAAHDLDHAIGMREKRLPGAQHAIDVQRRRQRARVSGVDRRSRGFGDHTMALQRKLSTFEPARVSARRR